MLELNKVYQGDCLEVMKEMADKSIDLCLTDPPYGIGVAKWDNKIPSKQYFEEMFRISKNQIIFGGNLMDLPKTEAWVVWYKQPFLKNQAECEMIWTSLKLKPKVFHYRYAGNCEGYPGRLKVNYKKKSVHPTEKPLELMNYLVKNFSQEGSIILDPFAGSGTTGVACRNLNRNYILIEKEPEYIEIINNRLK